MAPITLERIGHVHRDARGHLGAASIVGQLARVLEVGETRLEVASHRADRSPCLEGAPLLFKIGGLSSDLWQLARRAPSPGAPVASPCTPPPAIEDYRPKAGGRLDGDKLQSAV